jgi:glutamate-1-semialdehyde 2,1-aminomutase
MDRVAPAGPVYQAGTLSGNPISIVAGIATLRALRGSDAYDRLERTGAGIESVLAASAQAAGVPVRIQRVGSMLTVFFTESSEPIRDLAMVQATRADLFAVWHRALREHGVSWPPSAFEAAFFSLAHDGAAMDRIARAAGPAFHAVAAAG